MPKTTFKIKGLKQLNYVIDPTKMTPILRKHMERANTLNGIKAVEQIRTGISKGGFEKNADLTIAIKGEDKPLIGKSVGGAGGQLRQAITWKTVKKLTVFVGVLKINSFYNIAAIVHEGGQFKVSDKMRMMFHYLWLASVGAIKPDKLVGRASELWQMMPGNWKPLKKSTSAIVLPKRQFINKAFEDKSFRDFVKKNWEQAMDAAHIEINKKAGGKK